MLHDPRQWSEQNLLQIWREAAFPKVPEILAAEKSEFVAGISGQDTTAIILV
jgi:hypothetical protein